MKQKLAAVLVIYNQLLEESSSYQSFLQHSPMPLFIYDNSKYPQTIRQLENSIYKHNPTNPGVSTAYNEALNWALQQHITHLILLDADSTFSKGAIDDYRQFLRQSPNAIILPEVKAANRKISPFYFNYGKSFFGEGIPFGPINLGKILAINSGMVVPTKLMSALNGYNEKLPLDWSDIHFLKKAAKENVAAVHVPIKIKHELSEMGSRDINTAQKRFSTYFEGIKEVEPHFLKRIPLLFWAKLKALKLSLHYKSWWFIVYFVKRVYA